MRTLWIFAAGLSGWLPAAVASPVTLEDHARIQGAALAYAESIATERAPAGATVRVAAARLDPRLRLARCPADLQTFITQGQTAMPTSIGVRCDAGTSWSLYVPVRVEVLANVVVLAGPVSRGDSLSPADVRLELHDIARLSGGYLTDIDDVEGMALRRLARPGTVLNDSLLEPERIIRRGERVRLQSGAGGFAVQGEGEALTDAAAGERVRIRNVDSGIVIEGIARSPGLVVMRR